MADSQLSAVTAAEAAADAIKSVPGVITPFPGGMVASGSKVGSKYKFMNASTNEKVCVTLKDKVETELPDNVFGMMEIVIDGLDEESVSAAMKAGIEAACQVSGVLRIGAGNYGGDLGPYHFHLKEL
jgi:formylmethanofuran--tetrahydromethanopterin N-formyltransferase